MDPLEETRAGRALTEAHDTMPAPPQPSYWTRSRPNEREVFAHYARILRYAGFRIVRDRSPDDEP